MATAALPLETWTGCAQLGLGCYFHFGDCPLGLSKGPIGPLPAPRAPLQSHLARADDARQASAVEHTDAWLELSLPLGAAVLTCSCNSWPLSARLPMTKQTALP